MSNKVVQYTSADYASIKADLIAYVKAEHPEWTDHLETDFGVTLIELFSGIGDMTRFYQNVTANESFPTTARLFESLCRHAEWFGYHPHPAAAAQVDLTLTKSDITKSATIPIGTRVSTSDNGIVFEVDEHLYLPAGTDSGSTGAVHGHHIAGQVIGVSDGAKNQEYKLLTGSLVMLTEDENAISVYVGGMEWSEYVSLIWAAEANGFRMWIDSDRNAWVRFGDGVYGNIPLIGDQITVDYTNGGGVEGNVGASTLTRMVSSITNIASVTNTLAATGGANEETAEELRIHMPAFVVTRGRAVTRDDYSRLLEAFGEISKIDVDHPSTNIVNVYVLPQGGNTPGAALLASVRTYLADIRMITEDVRVLAPTFVVVDVSTELTLADDADSSTVLSEIETDLRAFLSQSVFASELHIHDLYDFFDEYDDVEHSTITLLAEAGGSGVADIELSAGEIMNDGEITLTVS